MTLSPASLEAHRPRWRRHTAADHHINAPERKRAMRPSPGNPRKDARRDQIQRLERDFAGGHYTEEPAQIAMRLVDHGRKLAALVHDSPPEADDDTQPPT